jgi:hypothetical protein
MGELKSVEESLRTASFEWRMITQVDQGITLFSIGYVIIIFLVLLFLDGDGFQTELVV